MDISNHGLVGVISLAALVCGCHGDNSAASGVDAAEADAQAVTIDGSTDASGQATGVRFHIDAFNDVPESIYVQLNEQDGQPAWITVTRDQERIYLMERCEIAECDIPTGVCGAALPRVQDFTAGMSTGSVEFIWDGNTSVIDVAEGCERRPPAPDGAYVATFCWSLSAVLDEGGGDPTSSEGAAGNVVNPTCSDVSFELPGDTDVVFEILGG